MADPIDLGVVNNTVAQAVLNQPFPQIYQPFVKENGVINESWLRLLIALWNRTGYAPGASSSDALLFGATASDELSVAQAEQNAAFGLLIQEAVSAEIARLGLDQQFAARVDPLEALLFMDAGGANSAADNCAACSEVIQVVSGTRVINPTSDLCATIFTN